MGQWAVISSRSKTQKDTEAECGDLGPAAAAPGPGELGMEAGGLGTENRWQQRHRQHVDSRLMSLAYSIC